MPSILKESKGPYHTRYGDGRVTVLPATSGLVFSSRPDTDRRIRPKDLFLNTTSRTVETRTTRNGVDVFFDPNATLPGQIQYERGPSGSRMGVPAGPSIGTIVQRAENRNDSKLREKIKNQTHDLITNLAEYRQTATLIEELGSDALRVYRSLRNGRSFSEFIKWMQRSGDHKARSAAGRWLQWQFGVKPLMGDIYESASSLAQKAREGLPIYMTQRSNDIFRETIGSQRDTYHTVFEAHVRCKARVRYIVRDASLKSLSQYGISNPLQAAWELTPWSFAVDWVLNVGDFVSSLDALVGVENLVVCRSGMIISSMDLYWHPADKRYKPWRSQGLNRTTFRRTPGFDLQRPNLRFKNPVTSWQRVLTALSLIVQKRSKS